MNKGLIRFWAVTAAVLAVLLIPASAVYAQQAPELTDLDRYVKKPDPSYSWKVVSATKTSDGMNQVVLDMISQNWLTPDKVNRTEWQHWLVLNFPDDVKSNVGFLMIDGGSNNDKAPTSAGFGVAALAKAAKSVIVQLKNIPNQPLIFENDGQPRVEDDLIGYTWDKFLETGDSGWPVRSAMVKAAVRAMDAVTEFMASAEGGQRKIDQYVVAGGSKRGWTTWLTGAVDDRVVGIAPMVIDVVNTNISMRHHFAAYGFWAPAVGNYVQHEIMQRMDHPRLDDLYKLEDPFNYKDRLLMPKLVINAAGDQFFLPDSSQFYWDQLKGPKAIRYVPNTDHGLGGSDVPFTVLAFYTMIQKNQPLPDFQWNITKNGIQIQANDRPVELKLWQATNPEARDFRMETLGKKYTSQSITLDGSGATLAQVATPEKGWTAYFVEATYDVGAPAPLKITSGIHVVPEIRPFETKDPGLPPSLTTVAQASEKISIEELQAAVEDFVKTGGLPNPDKVKVQVRGDRCYVNISEEASKLPAEFGKITKFLKEKGCKTVNFQIESGDEITLPPVGN